MTGPAKQPTNKEYIRTVIRDELRHATPSTGLVTAVYERTESDTAGNYEVDVEIIGTGLSSVGGEDSPARPQTHQAVPVTVPMDGVSRGIQSGSMVLVSYLEGNSDTPIVTDVLYDDENRAPYIQEDELRFRLGEDAVIEIAENNSGQQVVNVGRQPDDRGDVDMGLSLNLAEGSFSLHDAEGKGISFDGAGNGIIDWESIAQPWGAAGPVSWTESFAGASSDDDQYLLAVMVEDENNEPLEGAEVSIESIGGTGGSGDSGGDVDGQLSDFINTDGAVRVERTDAEATIEQALFDEINSIRSERDLETLTESYDLAAVSRWHSWHQAIEIGELSHSEEIYGEHWHRYESAGLDYPTSGENLHFNAEFEDPASVGAEVAHSWMDSEGHRENLLTPEWRVVGTGAYIDDQGSLYATQIYTEQESETA